MRRRHYYLAVGVALAVFATVAAGTNIAQAQAPTPPATYPCQDDPRHHAFDFWIGDWRVTQNGEFAGTNSIKPLMGHCTLFEEWTSATGRLGKSFNYYDPAQDHWRQIWISDSGTFIEFTGEARDGGIFYTAETTDAKTQDTIDHRFEFTPNDDGSVRQFWQISRDKGQSWQTVWDGHYEPIDDASTSAAGGSK